jgi:hypothetical protein
VPTEADTGDSGPAGDGQLVLYYLQRGGDGYSWASYEAVALPRNPRTPLKAIRYVFEELLKGAPPDVRTRGLGGMFTKETAGYLDGVTLRGGHLTVDFRDLSHVIPQASTSHGGAVFLTQIYAAAYQFDRVRQVSLGFDGRCKPFWGWLQGSCQTSDRAGWERRMAADF